MCEIISLKYRVLLSIEGKLVTGYANLVTKAENHFFTPSIKKFYYESFVFSPESELRLLTAIKTGLAAEFAEL